MFGEEHHTILYLGILWYVHVRYFQTMAPRFHLINIIARLRKEVIIS